MKFVYVMCVVFFFLLSTRRDCCACLDLVVWFPLGTFVFSLKFCTLDFASLAKNGHGKKKIMLEENAQTFSVSAVVFTKSCS